VSQWDVELTFVEGSSSKYWRARTDGGRLFVNYGRIGTNGQTQIKDFADEDRARSEMEKVAASKRKKGYAEGAGGGDEDGDEAPPAKAAAPAKVDKPRVADLELSAGGRKIEFRLAQEGARLRTVVVEHYDSPKLAVEAFDRIAGAMAEEGDRKVAERGDL